jgi:opine dehydrogenase
MDKMKIAVLGGGNSGYAVSAYFTHLGHSVNLYKKSFEKNKTEYDYQINSYGIFEFDCKVRMVTRDLSLALEEVQLAFVCVPAYCQETYFNDLLTCLKRVKYRSIYTVLMPDNYGCILFDGMSKSRGVEDYKKILSLNSSIFASRVIDDSNIDLKGIKKEILVSSIYPEIVDEGLSMLNRVINVFVKGKNILQVNFSNMNPIIHTSVIVMNAARIENTRGEFDFYGEGISPAVARVIEKVDKERMEIAKSLDIEVVTLMKYIENIYGFKKESLYETLSESMVHTKSNGPESMDSRYIKEDVPYGLMVMTALAKCFDIKTEAMDSLIVLGTIASDEIFDNDISLKVCKYFKEKES